VDQNLNKRANILMRSDTWEKIEDIAKRGNGTPSALVRFAVYEFLEKYYSDVEYRQYTKKHYSGLTRSRDTLYISENERQEERIQGVLKLEEAFK
jgi:hypothetical protein